jgi:hypothetical protein
METTMTPTPDADLARQRYDSLIAQAAALQQHRAAVLQEAAALARRYGIQHRTTRDAPPAVWRGEAQRTKEGE